MKKDSSIVLVLYNKWEGKKKKKKPWQERLMKEVWQGKPSLNSRRLWNFEQAQKPRMEDKYPRQSAVQIADSCNWGGGTKQKKLQKKPKTTIARTAGCLSLLFYVWQRDCNVLYMEDSSQQRSVLRQQNPNHFKR